jgi:hypothetical protein
VVRFFGWLDVAAGVGFCISAVIARRSWRTSGDRRHAASAVMSSIASVLLVVAGLWLALLG